MYNDYNKILTSTNFVGGAGKNDLSTVSGSTDIRADVTKEGTNYYQFYYRILGSKQDLDALGYYPANGREYTNLPAGQNPALSVEQTYIVQHVLHTSLNDAYSVLFEDVANIQFNVGTTANSDIIFGQRINYAGAVDIH